MCMYMCLYVRCVLYIYAIIVFVIIRQLSIFLAEHRSQYSYS